jgi:DNA polymerase sigma
MKKFTQPKTIRRKNNKKKGKMRWKKKFEEVGGKKKNRRNRKDDMSNDSTESVVKETRRMKKILPWIRETTVEFVGSMRLHHEIIDFYDYIKPKGDENNLRQATIKELKTLITKKWPMWQVKVFGSFPNNLHLSDSDIDIVVFKNNYFNFSTDNFTQYDLFMNDSEMLSELFKHLTLTCFAKEIRYVDARVPILKVKAKGGINLDIS